MPDLTGRIEGEKMGLFGKKKVDFVSPAGGRLMNITEVADPAFSSKMLGDGFAVDLTDGEIGAPFDGEVTAAFPTGHAFGLKRKDGLECLIHVGMDTVQLNGKGFDVKVKQGQMVKKGDTLVVVDLDEVRACRKITGNTGYLHRRNTCENVKEGYTDLKGRRRYIKVLIKENL